MSERICPHCGGDQYMAEEFPRLNQRLARVEQEYQRLHRNAAVREARAELDKFEQETRMSWLQQKTQRQRRTIRRLEEKMRRQGEQPHEDKPLGE